jgi:hypothetical protein
MKSLNHFLYTIVAAVLEPMTIKTTTTTTTTTGHLCKNNAHPKERNNIKCQKI